MRALALLVVFTSFAWGARADEPPAEAAPSPTNDESEGTPSDASRELPDALPPLWDETPTPALPLSPFALRVFAQGRVRLELDDARDRDPDRAPPFGFALTGRVGVAADAPFGDGLVVVGDGARLGHDPGGLANALVAPTAVPFLHAVRARFFLDLFGARATLALGRMPFVVADGRWIGAEPFDPRGRTLDGGVVREQLGLVSLALAGFFLGPLLPDDDAVPSAFGVLSASATTSSLHVDGYGIVHRDGTPTRDARPPVTATTLGGRLALSLSALTARFGADVQAQLLDEAPLAPAGVSLHLETSLQLHDAEQELLGNAGPFVGVSSEVTAGRSVVGRVFRAPAPTQARMLGTLDLVAADNTASGALVAGLTSESGFAFDGAARVILLADPRGALLDTSGNAILRRGGKSTARLAFWELDLHARVPVTTWAALSGAYGIGFTGDALASTAPVQRFWLAVAFALDPQGFLEAPPPDFGATPAAHSSDLPSL